MNRTIGIVLTALSTLLCGCLAIMSCIFGGMIAAGVPFDTTVNGVNTGQQTFPVPVGITLLCLSLIFILVPIAIGFFTFRAKPAAPVSVISDEPIPPAS